MTQFISLLESHIQVGTDEIRHLIGVFENQERYFARNKPITTYWLRSPATDVGVDLLNMFSVLPSNADSGVDYFLDDGALTLPPPQPSPHHVFNYTTRQWEDPRTPDTEWPLVRAQRSRLLAGSDWTQLPDVPLATKDAWATYRQALRDITTQADPFSITWPPAP